MRPGTAIAGLGIVLALYLLRATSSWSPHDFGYLHEDTLYVGSARSLAEGSGYRVPSLPGTPAQTKYPVGYPLVLSLLWRTRANLGQVLQGALFVNALCGCLFLAGAFRLVGQLGAGRLAALLITLICSLHPMLVDLARMPLSDLLFIALSTWTLWAAGRHLEPGNPAASLGWAGALVLGAAAVGARSIGLASKADPCPNLKGPRPSGTEDLSGPTVRLSKRTWLRYVHAVAIEVRHIEQVEHLGKDVQVVTI